MICQRCGQQLNSDAQFCSFCGKKVIHVPPVFTMTGRKTDIATGVVRDYSEWGFYNNPDADLDPETGRKPEYSYSALEALPDENHLKWASDFIKAEQMEAALRAEAAAKAEAEADAKTEVQGPPGSIIAAVAAAEDGASQIRAASDAAEGSAEDGAAPSARTESLSDDTDQGEDAAAAPKQKLQYKKKKKKKVPVAVIVAAVVLLAGSIAGGAYFLFDADKTYEVDLNALMVEPKVIGYNDYGEMALMPQIDSAKEDKWLRTVEFDTTKEGFREVLNTVEYTPDKTAKLSNGDVVTITISYDKKLAEEKELIVHAQDTTYEVSGLEKGTDLAYDPDSYHAYYDDFILPESDRTKLTREDVIYSTNGDMALIQQAINEIYARHGYIFGDEKYNTLFRSFDWYVPMYKPDKFDMGWLNKYEKANLNLVTSYRDDLRAEAKEAEKKAAEEEAAKKKAEEEKAAEATKETVNPTSASQ